MCGELEIQVIWCQPIENFPHMDDTIPLSSPLEEEDLQFLQPIPISELFATVYLFCEASLYVLQLLDITDFRREETTEP